MKNPRDCVYLEKPYNENPINKCCKKFNRGKKCKLTIGAGKCRCYLSIAKKAEAFIGGKQFWESSYGALCHAFASRIGTEANRFSDTANERHKDGHYRFIPKGVGDSMRILTHSYSHIMSGDRGFAYRKPMFLDCGCGVGNIALLAHFIGFDAYGIEYDKATLKRGKKLFEQFGIHPAKLFQGDILEYEGYHKYDLLYGFCPMIDPTKEHDFELKVMLEMKKGALIAGLPVYSNQKIGKHHVYFRKLILVSGDNCHDSANPFIKIGQD